MLHKRYQFDSMDIMCRAEQLVNAASNRYRITVQVANRAKRRRYEDMENMEDPVMKPVLRAIIEMSDEVTESVILGEETRFSTKAETETKTKTKTKKNER